MIKQDIAEGSTSLLWLAPHRKKYKDKEKARENEGKVSYGPGSAKCGSWENRMNQTMKHIKGVWMS